MSLDVYLKLPVGVKIDVSCIFIREDGQRKEISREEWNRRNPGREPVVVEREDCVFEANITHNLMRMAEAAGIYVELWHPERIDITRAGQLIEPLKLGLARLQADPEKFKSWNPSNGWGNYELLVQFVENYLRACETYPDAVLEIST